MLSRCRILRASFWKPVSEKLHYDVCVIGGGPAGIAAAMRAVDYQKKVCLIEKNRVGGTDLWNGTLQSKTMWEFSNYMRKIKGNQGRRLFGDDLTPAVELDEEAMRESLNHVSSTRAGQITAALTACENVDYLSGQASFNNNNEILFYNRVTKEYRHISADYFVIATGSRPRSHPFAPTDGELIVTSDHIMNLPLPDKLVVVGAGVIGCEFASIFSGLGKTKVSVIDKQPHILKGEDEDIIRMVEKQMTDNGVVIHHNSILYDMQPWRETKEEAQARGDEKRRSGVQYTIMDKKTKKLETFQVDRALISIGRVMHYDGLGLENTTLRTKDGRLVANSAGRCEGTNHIYAVGDCCTSMYLVSMGEHQGRAAVDDIYGSTPPSVFNVTSSMSSSAYLTQNVSSVGLNETQCRKKNIAYIAARLGYDLVSRAVAAGSVGGFIKIIVSDDASRTILGVRAVGLNSSTLVDLGSLAIYNGQSVYELADRLTAYPAVSQGFQECIHVILGCSELKPDCFPSFTLTRWAPDHYSRGVTYQEEERRKEEAAKKPSEAETPKKVSPNTTEAASSKERVMEETVTPRETVPEPKQASTPSEPLPEEPVKEVKSTPPEEEKTVSKEEASPKLGSVSKPSPLRMHSGGPSTLPGSYFRQ